MTHGPIPATAGATPATDKTTAGANRSTQKAQQSEQDEAVYPETIPDAQSTYSGSSFDDLNADAQGDIRMTFLHEDGTQTVLVWYWDAEGGYVYQPDCSALHAPGEKT